MRVLRLRAGSSTLVGVLIVVAALVAALAGGGPAAGAGNSPVNGAAFTTVNESYDGTGHCKNGNPNNNCNIYDGKQYVWLNGGPVSAGISDGTYFFAVLVPGGQADPNDGSAKNLSDDYDTSANRTFTVTNHVLSYAGTHIFNSNKIRLFPYADTTNNGGVYIMAICATDGVHPVDPSTCKYDAFKVGKAAPLKAPTISKDATGTYTRTYGWSITKTVDTNEIDTDAGTDPSFQYTVQVSHDTGTVGAVSVTGTISVFNPNADANGNVVPVDISGVTDQLSDGTTCSVVGGGAQTLTAAKTQFAYACALQAVPSKALSNTATVTWPDQVDPDSGGTLDAGSANFSFSNIAFTETTVDECAAVSDTYAGDLGTVCVGDDNPATFVYFRSVSAADSIGTCTAYDNTASYLTNDTATTDTASQTVKVCVGAPPTVSKTVTPSYTRKYRWSITKTVDAAKIKLAGGTATPNYTVTAKQTGKYDTDYVLTGVITVTNPNDWESITVDVTDYVGSADCTVTDGTGAVIPAGSSVDFDYVCTWNGGQSYVPTSGTNTAMASWDPAAAHTEDSSATGTKDFDFSTVAPSTIVYPSVTVTDTFNGATTTLGVVTGTDTLNAKGVFTYPRSIEVPAYGCTSRPNTARLVETLQSAGASVTVCGPAKTAARTIGFWRNTNGQTVIKGGASSGGVCASATWLRKYAPFTALSATATCAATASWVASVLSGATASGASMNAMLKAQMLATALNVYFSSSALGGNKLAAPGPIGSVSIDLTKVCTMLDAGTTATCNGVYQNASGAFQGAASMTVSQLLAYAASKSNAGGSTWYANVPATQGLAKNLFDAIDNVKAFAP